MEKNEDPEALGLQRQKRMLNWIQSKDVPHVPTQEERQAFPQKTAKLFSKVFFWWISPVLKTGYSRTLQPEDLFKLSEDIKVDAMAEIFFEHFRSGLSRSRANHIALKCKGRGETPETSSVTQEEDLQDYIIPRLVSVIALFKTFKWQYLLSCVFLTLSNVSNVTTPLLSKKLIQFVEYRTLGLEPTVNKGIGYSIGASLLVMVSGLLNNHFFYRSMLTGAQAKAVLTKAILEKSFMLSAESKHKYPTGKITSMMSTDLARIDLALGLQPIVLVFPIPFAIAIAILVVNIGAAAAVGVGIMLVFMVSIGACMGVLFAYRERVSAFTDARVDYMKEVLNDLKIIKLYAWEPPYHKNISEVRRSEMKLIYRMQLIRGIAIAFALSITIISSMVAFLVLYKIGAGKRSAANIFSSISLFNILAFTVLMLPFALSTGSDGLVGLGRVGQFLASSEIDPEAVKTHADPAKLISMEQDRIAIEVTGASFEWETFDLDDEEEEEDSKDKKSKDKKKKKAKEDKDAKDLKSKKGKKSKESRSKQNDVQTTIKEKTNDTDSDATPEIEFPGLHNIDLNIKKGEFIVITGVIGSGKSSLLNALSGFMNRTGGSINVNGSLLLCGYPWVQNATVQDNITFGEEFDEARYKEVIYACSLESDLEIFPGGDQTEVGERGITLSGGQKARVSLARAVYANKDIILLDDVLSAVDARVGRHIMDNCILGMLKDSTRVLATHQLSLIGAADRIIFLNGEGGITVGTLEELKQNSPGFSNLMAFNSNKAEEEEEEADVEDDKFVDEEVKELEKEMIQRQVSRKSVKDEEKERRAYNENNTDDGRLILDEEKSVNRIKVSVYIDYVNIGTGRYPMYVAIPILLASMIFATFCQLFTNTWLSFWTEGKFKGMSDNVYIGIYVMFTMLSVMFLIIEFVILVSITNTAASSLNVMAVDKVLHTPMAFMDTTPMGRILNRFSKDTDALDNEVGDEMIFFIVTLCSIIGILILCVIFLPWFAIALPFMGYIFAVVTDYYQASAREIKRLEAIQRSHVYNNFSEILNGMNTIKLYGQERRFMAKSDAFIDNMNEAYYLTIANQRWLAIHLDMIASCIALLISILCVCRVFKLSASSVGLLLSYVFEIANQLSELIRTFTQMENSMNSVERISEYAFKLPQEAPYVITETTPHESWPSKGEIKFENVNLAYRPGLPLVLKNVNFNIKSSEKIGICGRTGAGKSSIMTALYRLSELQSGKVFIDDVDVSTLGLQSLRSKLSIIPQDPVLFRGTIRKNLDPFDESSDDKLWDALRRTGLIEAARLETVKKQVKVEATDDTAAESLHKFHLNQMVEDEGSNFSLGERQLIAFARALVRDSRILILDEATSSVDYETDSKIQATIVKEFSKCTILCIAHRLKTILNYDRILVLDRGEIKEFDTPLNLFRQEHSIFQQMCERSNITEEDFKDTEKF